MAKNVSTHEAKTHLSRIIEEVLTGAEVVVCRSDVPVVKIVRYQETHTNSRIVSHPVAKVGVKSSAPVKYTEDAFAPLVDDEELKSWGMN